MCRVRAKILVTRKSGRDQNLRSHATHSTSLARERLLRRLDRLRLDPDYKVMKNRSFVSELMADENIILVKKRRSAGIFEKATAAPPKFGNKTFNCMC